MGFNSQQTQDNVTKVTKAQNILSLRNNFAVVEYTRSSHNAQFGSWKKPCYAKIALVGLYCMIQLTRNSPTNAYIAQKTVLRENRVLRNRVMRGLGVQLGQLPPLCTTHPFKES